MAEYYLVVKELRKAAKLDAIVAYLNAETYPSKDVSLAIARGGAGEISFEESSKDVKKEEEADE